jgi:hypothetical protein
MGGIDDYDRSPEERRGSATAATAGNREGVGADFLSNVECSNCEVRVLLSCTLLLCIMLPGSFPNGAPAISQTQDGGNAVCSRGCGSRGCLAPGSRHPSTSFDDATKGEDMRRSRRPFARRRR